MRITIDLSPALAARLRITAQDNFETPDSYIPMVLDKALPDRQRRRDGGKAPARKLLRPVPPELKRGRILNWFETASEPTVTAAARHFGMTRRAVLMTLVTLRAVHGIGYRIDGNTDRVAILMPPQ